MSELDDLLAAVGPGGGLQIHPDILLMIHRPVLRDADDKPTRDERATPAAGPLLAVVVTTGDMPEGEKRQIRVGAWVLEVAGQKEQIASAVDAGMLEKAEALDIRAYALKRLDRIEHAPTDSTPLVFVAQAPRPTKWQPMHESDRMLADDRRGLRFRADGHGGVVMDWWHAKGDMVFSNVEAETSDSQPFIRMAFTALEERPAGREGIGGWFQATSTHFERIA